MLKRIGAEESGEFKAVASGTLPSGKPVVVNANGTVSVVGIGAASIGSATKWVSGESIYISATYDSNSDRVVIAYRNSSSGDNGFAVVGTVSDTSISFGTPVSFNSGSSSTNFTSTVFDSNSNKVVISYQDGGNSSYGTAIVGTVDPSDNSISFGTEVVFNSANSDGMTSTFDTSANKVIIAYRDQGSSRGEAIIGTVSGTSISFGSEVVLNNTHTNDFSASYDSSSNKTIIAYRDDGSTGQPSKAKVGTVSGTSISFGSATTFETGIAQYTVAIYDSVNNKTNIFYMDGGDGDKGKGVIGTVSGTSISFTSPSNFYTDAGINALTAVYDSNSATSVIGIRGASAYGYAIPITSDGSSFTVGSSTTITTNAYGTHAASVFDPDQKKVVFGYSDGDDSGHGKAQVYNAPATTLTSENYIGMSSGNVTYDSATQAVGTEVVMNSGSTTGFAAAFDSSTGKVVIAFSDGTDGQKGKAIVGTVDAANNSISFGSEVVFQNSEITGDQMDCVFDSNANKVVIFYTDTNNPSTDDRTGTAIVGTVSGTSISFGTKAAFESGNTQYIAATFDSNLNKVVVAYRDTAHSARGKAIVGTVSGTDITFGSEADFSTANEVEYISATFDSNSNKVVISWSDKGNNSNAGTAIVGTVSGTSISFGSAVVFEAPITKDISSTFDTVNNKVIITYKDQGNSSYGTAIVGTVSGTSISFGTAVVFASAETEYTSVIYDANAEKILILFKDGANSNRPTIIVGTVSGTSISFGTEVVVMDVEGVTINPGVAFDSTNNKVVLSYTDTTGSDNGMAQVVQLAYDNTTRVNIADGNRTSINIIGSVIENQNSLTAGQQYFVQTDGTIGTTADSPSVLAGTAISATELLVKT